MTRCELWIRCTVTAYCQARLKSQVSNSVGHSAAYYLNVRTFPVSLRAIYTKSRLFNYKIIATNTGVWMKLWICANGRRNSKPVGYFFFRFLKINVLVRAAPLFYFSLCLVFWNFLFISEEFENEGRDEKRGDFGRWIWIGVPEYLGKFPE